MDKSRQLRRNNPESGLVSTSAISSERAPGDPVGGVGNAMQYHRNNTKLRVENVGRTWVGCGPDQERGNPAFFS